MKNPFKENDRVVCVENDRYEDSLTIGKEYVVIGSSEREHTNNGIYIINNHGEKIWVFCRRFRAVESNNDKAILIGTNGNPIFSGCIQNLLFEEGFGWGEKAEKVVQYANERYLLVSFDTPIWGKKTIYYSGSGNFLRDFRYFDGMKDFEKITQVIFSWREPKVLEVPTINGFAVKYKKNDEHVTINGVQLSISFLPSILSDKDVQNIINYCSAINGNE